MGFQRITEKIEMATLRLLSGSVLYVIVCFCARARGWTNFLHVFFMHSNVRI